MRSARVRRAAAADRLGRSPLPGGPSAKRGRSTECYHHHCVRKYHGLSGDPECPNLVREPMSAPVWGKYPIAAREHSLGRMKLSDERVTGWMGPLGLLTVIAIFIGFGPLSGKSPSENASGLKVAAYYNAHMATSWASIYVVGLGLALWCCS